MELFANAGWFHTVMSLFVCNLGVVKFPEVYATNNTGNDNNNNTLLLLISFDGFRWDYLDLVKKAGKHTPNFDYLIKRGVKPKWVRTTFTTSTVPNHYSMATGMYQEGHGIVGKEMFDPLFNETFYLDDIDFRNRSFWWNNGTEIEEESAEPIWVTNQKGKGSSKAHKFSGVLFWIGSNMEIHGMRPHYFTNYDHVFPFKLRVDLVLVWFLNKVTPINLGLIYFSQPDDLGHDVGPESPLMIDKIVELDDLVGYLIEQLKEKDLFDRMNIIITSDHGLAHLKGSINIDDYINPNLFKVYGSSTVWNVLPNKGEEDNVYAELKKVPNLTVYKKSEIPEEFHYRHNRRIMPLLVMAPEGYTLCSAGRKCYREGGAHGYNNSLTSMHAIFIAHGPSFKRGYTAKAFESVDIYPLICTILDITPAANNGSLANVQQLLRKPSPTLVQLAAQHVTASNAREYSPAPIIHITNIAYFIADLVQAYLLVVTCGIIVALIDMP